MEMGNMIFGHSRGNYPIDRDSWSNVFFNEFIYEINADGYGIVDGENGYENDTFKIMPYDWDAECNCGLDDLIDEWWIGKVHKEDCYQKLVDKELIKNGWTVSKFGDLDKPKNMNYEKSDKIERKVRKKYCNMFNLSFPEGCAVHCTCGLDSSFEEWIKDKEHKSDCRLIQPNFLYKPTGFQIMWYKYALRDSYMNQDIDLDEFKNILKDCVRSYYKDKNKEK